MSNLKVNHKRSVELAEKIDALPHMCWLNSFRAWPLLPPSALYVEGFVVCKGIPFAFDHGWLVNEDEIIDVTLRDVELYIAGVTYTRTRFLSIVDEIKESGTEATLPLVHHTHGAGGYRHKNYQNAQQEAWAHVSGQL